MHEVVLRAEKLATEGARLLGERPPAADALALCAGAEPSVAQALEGLQDLHAMLRDELALQLAAVAAVRYDTSEADFAALLAAVEAQPNVDAPRLEALFRQAAAAAAAAAATGGGR
jgi:hypothetical protein